ncbi:MAG: LCP family protein [Bacilli bacterium]
MLKKIGIYLSATLLVLGLALAGSIYFKVNSTLALISENKGRENATSVEKSTYSIALIGINSENGRKTNDGNVIITVNPKTKKTTVKALPANLSVKVSKNGKSMPLNTVFKSYGSTTTAKVISAYTKTKYNYYLQFDYAGFKEIIDSINGITLTVAEPITYGAIQIKAGKQKMNGATALAYLRSGATAEIRQQRLAEVTNAASSQSFSIVTLTNYNKILDAIGNSVRTNLNSKEITSIAKSILLK